MLIKCKIAALNKRHRRRVSVAERIAQQQAEQRAEVQKIISANTMTPSSVALGLTLQREPWWTRTDYYLITT